MASLRDASFDAAGHSYRIAANRLLFGENAVPIDYFIGSSAAGRSFLFQRDGYLFELPVTWYSQKEKWDASPGYEHDSEVRLNRAVEPSCLWCHASRVRPVYGTQNRYAEPPFLENGVGCERCHGAGSEHIRDPRKYPLVNPAKLEPTLRDAVCSQCHLTGEARIETAGHSIGEFRAGERLSDYVTYLVRAGGGSGLKVTSHVEKLAASACKRASGNALWCGTCHDPHTNASKAQESCVSCHTNSHHAQEICAGCHMPKSHVIDGGHGVLTDHSIPSGATRAASPASRDLIAFLGTADDRALGLAYAQAGDPRARDYLLRVKPADAQVLLRLAALEPDGNRSIALYQSALRMNPSQIVAMVNLGVLYAKAGRIDEAAHLWEKALEANPATEEAVINLAQVVTADKARALLLRYLQFNPDSVAAKARLNAIR